MKDSSKLATQRNPQPKVVVTVIVMGVVFVTVFVMGLLVLGVFYLKNSVSRGEVTPGPSVSSASIAEPQDDGGVVVARDAAGESSGEDVTRPAVRAEPPASGDSAVEPSESPVRIVPMEMLTSKAREEVIRLVTEGQNELAREVVEAAWSDPSVEQVDGDRFLVEGAFTAGGMSHSYRCAMRVAGDDCLVEKLTIDGEGFGSGRER